MKLPEFITEMDEKTRLKIGIAIAILLALAITYSAINNRIATMKKRLVSREATLQEMLQLQQQFHEASAQALQTKIKLAAVKPDDSPSMIIDEIGIKGKNSQIQSVKGNDRPDAVEDAAQVKIDALTGNEAINLLYRIENGAKPVVIRKVNLRTRYDDPSKLDLNMIIALLKPMPAGAK
ncbi:MAG: general secretion pathway protein GspM [Desulfuromonadales bacterium]|nr:general secretion pathway protein GspM [Desulfuromonadales bacterium]